MIDRQWRRGTSPATISGIPTAVSLPTASGRFARQQQTLPRPSLPDYVPDPVLLTVLSCPFYGVTPSMDLTDTSRQERTRARRGAAESPARPRSPRFEAERCEWLAVVPRSAGVPASSIPDARGVGAFARSPSPTLSATSHGLPMLAATTLCADSARSRHAAEFRCRAAADPVLAHPISAVARIGRITFKRLI
jgi:hypothetical protein